LTFYLNRSNIIIVGKVKKWQFSNVISN